MTIVYRLHLLGVPGVGRADAVRPIAAPQKALALIGYLAQQSEATPRSQLAALLWSDTTDHRSRRNLTHTLGQITALLPGCLRAWPQTVHLADDGTTWTDIAACHRLLLPPSIADAGSDVTPLSVTQIEQGVALYRGEFLAGLALPGCPEFETWLLRERERWRRQIVGNLITLVRHFTYLQQHERAELHARRLIELEPWHEEGHRALMLLLAYSGRRIEAITTFERLERMLKHELGLTPAAETRALNERIRAGPLAHELGGRMPVLIDLNQSVPHAVTAPVFQHHDWSDAPPAEHCFGRRREIAELERQIIGERSPITAISGMGGIGKTLLAAHVARTRSDHFTVIVWRSLLNEPALPELLRDLIDAISNHAVVSPRNLDAQLSTLLDLLARRRCLIVLDNCERILRAGTRAGSYLPGYEPYAQLLRRISLAEHQSCLLLTSWEQLPGWHLLQSENPRVGSLHLAGMPADACRQLLQARGIVATPELEHQLADRSSGNPFALQIVAETVKALFGGDLEAFLREETLIVDDIRVMLEQQWLRLTRPEQAVLRQLAWARAPMNAARLRELLPEHSPHSPLVDVLLSLRRRSWIEQQDSSFALPTLMHEYIRFAGEKRSRHD